MTAGEAVFDLARPGLAVYGWKPAGWLPDEPRLEPAMAVRSRTVVIKETAPGARIGYSQTPAAAGRRLGVLPIGYADGIPADWGLNGGYVLFPEGPAPLVGSVSMDSCVVDLTDVPGEGRGSIALMLGSGPEGLLPPHEIAAATGRSVYEVLVALNGRLPRRHHD
jgi:alanine racemase